MGLEHTGVHLRCYGTLTFYFTTSEFAARTAFCCVKLGIDLFANLYNIVRQETAFLEPICELSNTSQGLSPYWLYWLHTRGHDVNCACFISLRH
jgi:hypothetical protein